MYSAENEIVDRREMLRVKVKSLAEEARIIRREEQRTWGAFRTELHNHRVLEVRRAARNAHLAYGLIRGRSIEDMEEDAHWRVKTADYPGQWQALGPNWQEVGRLIKKYGAAGDYAQFSGLFEPGSSYTSLKPGNDHRIKERRVREPAEEANPAAAVAKEVREVFSLLFG